MHDLFAVSVKPSAGNQGDDRERCSFVYDVFALDGQQLAAAASPVAQRPYGAFDAGQHGMAYYEGADPAELVLLWVDETPLTIAVHAEPLIQ